MRASLFPVAGAPIPQASTITTRDDLVPILSAQRPHACVGEGSRASFCVFFVCQRLTCLNRDKRSGCRSCRSCRSCREVQLSQKRRTLMVGGGLTTRQAMCSIASTAFRHSPIQPLACYWDSSRPFPLISLVFPCCSAAEMYGKVQILLRMDHTRLAPCVLPTQMGIVARIPLSLLIVIKTRGQCASQTLWAIQHIWGLGMLGLHHLL